MAAFATKQNMADRSEGAIPITRPFLDAALDAATKRIQNYCRWHIAPEVETTLVLRGQPGVQLWLPSAHVVEITSLTDGGTPVDIPTLEWEEGGLIDRISWVAGRRTVQVTFTHGYEAVPDDLVDLTLMIAARSLGSPLGVVREQTLSSSVTYSQAAFNVAGGTVLLEHEKQALAAYRLGYLP